MRSFLILWRRQLAAYLTQSGFYAMSAMFLFVAGLNFRALLSDSFQTPLSLGNLMFDSFYLWLMLLAVITVLAMSLLSEEKRSRTLEAILTAPVTDTCLVLAKYAAAATAFALMCAPLAAYPFLLRAFSLGGTAPDAGLLASGCLGLALVGGYYLAIGLFVSSLTRSQAVAAILIFPVLCLFFFADVVQPPAAGSLAGAVLAHVPGARHIMDFSRGIIDARPVFHCVSGAAFFLFATVKVVESRHWK